MLWFELSHALNGDPRTRNNTLPFWQGALEAEDELAESAPALAAGRDQIDKAAC